MKKLVLVSVLLVLVLLLTGCGKSKLEQQAEQIRNTKITVDQKTVQEVNQGIQNYNGN